eukprot:scaffold10854_cov155-Skeletonema_dohrnii-CCMP3373.AAC.20
MDRSRSFPKGSPLYISKSNMPSSLKDACSDSLKGVSERRIREGRLDKVELLYPPLMAEFQLETDDIFFDDELCGS